MTDRKKIICPTIFHLGGIKIQVVRLEAKIYTSTRGNTDHRLIQMTCWGISTPCCPVIVFSQSAINILILKMFDRKIKKD